MPADLRLAKLRTATLRVEQASLTGESVAVAKRTEAVDDDGAELQAQECMVFAGTTVSNGQATGIVAATGMRTQIGRIQASITAAGAEEEDTPLKKKLDEFGDLLTKCITGICVLVWLTNYKSFITWEYSPNSYFPDASTFKFSLTKCTYYFKIAVALAVAAIPEGLPAVITTCLALGTRKMARKNAIVRKLASVETLGCTTVICSDKTGTLTTGQMSAVRLVTLGEALPKSASGLRVLEVTGTTFSPEEGEVVGLPGRSLDAALRACASVCALCNEARIEWREEKGAYVCVGEPTEGALKVLVEKLGAPSPSDEAAIRSRRARGDRVAASEGACGAYTAAERKLALLEFDRNRKSMSVLVGPSVDAPSPPPPPSPAASTRSHGNGHANGGTNGGSSGGGSHGGATRLLVKGAAEAVLDRCSHGMLADGRREALTKAARDAIGRTITSMAGSALRVLALAIKEGDAQLGELAGYTGEPNSVRGSLHSIRDIGFQTQHENFCVSLFWP